MTTADPELISALAQYEIGGPIGSGGMGDVYAGRHRALLRNVAIKQLPRELAANPKSKARFDREAQLLAGLDHPHVVPVYDYLSAGPLSLIVMERLDGGTVWSRFTEQGLTPEQSCAVGLGMLAGLHAAHAHGVLHLDVKPKNLLFSGGGLLKVADFGISRVLSDGEALATQTGEMLGTPAYLAPEQALGQPLTPATDVYAAATVIYELLTGRRPYSSEGGTVAIVYRHITEDPAPIGPPVPAPLAGAVMRGLSRDPAHRYPDAETFAVALAGAAAAAFRPGWLDRSGVPVHLSPRVVAAAVTPSAPLSPAQHHAAVRPSTTDTRTLGVADLGHRPPVPVRTVLADAQPSPLWPALAAAGALAVLVGLVFAQPAAPERDADLQLRVAGQPVVRTADLDLTRPVTLSGPTTATEPVVVKLSLSVAGIPLGSSTSEPITPSGGAWETPVDAPAASRWLAGGAVTGTVDVLDEDGTELGTQTFTVRPEHPAALSVMSIGGVLLLLFTIAYMESMLRPMRRGRRVGSGLVAIAGLGLVSGAALWMLLSALLASEPHIVIGLGAALLGAVTSGLAAHAILRATRLR